MEILRGSTGINNVFRFEAHQVSPEGYQSKKDCLKEVMLATFHRGQTNVLFRENMYGSQDQEDWYKAQLKEHKSYMKAGLSTAVRASQGRNPLKSEIEQLSQDLESLKSGDGVLAYRIMIDEVLDEISGNGISVIPAFEKTSQLRTKYPNKPYEEGINPLIYLLLNKEQQAEQFQHDVETGIQFRKDRDEIVKGQLLELQKQLARQNKPGNILTIMGNLHTGLFESMPFKVRNASTAMSEPLYITPNYDNRYFHVHAGLPFDPKNFV